MKRGTPRHPKVGDLCERLKIQSYEAIGILELLWHFTAEFAPQGDIGRYSDKRIESAIGYFPKGMRKTGMLIAALIDTHWVDISREYRLITHDWHDHCDEYVRKRLERSGRAFLTVQTVRDKLTELRQTNSATMADNGSLPLPEPEPLPEPYIQKQLRAPVVSAMRFDEFKDKYPRKQKMNQAAGAYVSVVTAENENRMFACLDRYNDSEEVHRGVVMNPDKWLFQQAADGWAGMWPAHTNGKAEKDEDVMKALRRIL